jgi:hypothetical protein
MAQIEISNTQQLRLATRLRRIFRHPSDMESLLHYIDTQEEHHRKYNFQDELRALLKKYGIEHDERYMWD